MTTAYISGRGKIAYFCEGDKCLVLKPPFENGPIEADKHLADQYLADCGDVRVLNNVSLDEVQRSLITAIKKSLALDFLVMVLDMDFHASKKSEAIESLDLLLGEDGVEEHLQNIVFACPIKDEIDLRRAVANLPVNSRSFKFVSDIGDRQETVRKVVGQWKDLPLQSHLHESEVSFKSKCLKAGVFRALVLSMTDRSTLNNAQFVLSNKLRIEFNCPGANHILHHWVTELRKVVPDRQAEHKAIHDLVDDEPEVIRGREFGSNLGYKTAVEKKDAAITQVNRVVALAIEGKDDAAKNMLDELVASQISQKSGEEFAIKSLSRAAKILADKYRHDFALDCINRALQLRPDVPAYLQAASLLIEVHEFDNADEYYKKALALTSESQRESRQQILSAQAHARVERGEFQEALNLYRSISIPQDSVFVGIADTYRRMGDYDTAMFEYQKILRAHDFYRRIQMKKIITEPELHRAYAGIAEIAKRRSDPHKAIDIYNRILSDIFLVEPESREVYRIARGQCLKQGGQFSDAIKVSKALLEENKYNYRARNLLTASLELAGMDSELESNETSDSVVGSLILAAKGDVDEARRQLTSVIEKTKIESHQTVLCSKMTLDLACNDFHEYDKTKLRLSIRDKVTRDIVDVLDCHRNFESATGFPKLRRGPSLLRKAVNCLSLRDFKQATAFEIKTLLMVA